MRPRIAALESSSAMLICYEQKVFSVVVDVTKRRFAKRMNQSYMIFNCSDLLTNKKRLRLFLTIMMFENT